MYIKGMGKSACGCEGVKCDLSLGGQPNFGFGEPLCSVCEQEY